MLTSGNFTIVDVETTGGSPLTSRVIELGIIRVERGEVATRFKSLINPGREIPKFITSFTGITDRMVRRAPSFADVAEEVFPLFEDSVFVAHNSSFDYKFLSLEFERAGYGFSMDTLCTVRLSRVLYPGYKKHNLGALIERFDFKCRNRHRAYDDAKVLWDFLRLVQKEFGGKELEAAITRTIKKIPPASQRKLPKVLVPEVIYAEETF